MPQARVLAILQLFEQDRAVLTVEEMANALRIPASTTYRHVRELVLAGFLDPVTRAGYSLGPGFIRYDRILRQTDSVIRVASPVMHELLDRTTQNAAVILCRRFKDCVMCVHEVHGRAPHAPTAYGRGVTMPLFVGATSKVILANLPDRTLKAVYERNAQTIGASLSLDTWTAFKDHLREIRRAGYALTRSEVAQGRMGLAAPIFRGDQLIAGISLIREDLGGEEYGADVVSAAREISRRVSDSPALIPR
jgi:DNA-binding IclR family transcriptional regulator